MTITDVAFIRTLTPGSRAQRLVRETRFRIAASANAAAWSKTSKARTPVKALPR